MMFRRLHRRLLVSAVLALATGLCGAESAAGAAKKPTAPAPSSGNNAAAKGAATATANADIQAALDQFKMRRDKVLAERAELEKKLKNATEAQKKSILEQIEQQQKELLEEQRALGKRIRDDMRNLRPSMPPPNRR